MERELAITLVQDYRYVVRQRLLSTTRISAGSKQSLAVTLETCDQVILWLQNLPVEVEAEVEVAPEVTAQEVVVNV